MLTAQSGVVGLTRVGSSSERKSMLGFSRRLEVLLRLRAKYNADVAAASSETLGSFNGFFYVRRAPIRRAGNIAHSPARARTNNRQDLRHNRGPLSRWRTLLFVGSSPLAYL